MTIEPQDEDQFAANLVEIIQKSRIFSTLDRTACEALLPRLEKIILKQGEILFEQGQESDCLYILVEGQLLASLTTKEGTQKLVGTIEKGETVGELGAFSKQPRSLTIRAGVDCHILKLPKEEFDLFTKDHPQLISHIIDLIINRSQNTIKLISQKKIYQHLAIINGDSSVPLPKFIEKIKENFPEKSNYILVEDRQADLASLIDEAEHHHQSVIFILTPDNFSTLGTKINHIGEIYVIVNGDVLGHLNEFALKMLSRQFTPFTTQYELVLIHDDHVEQPQDTLHWLEEADFTLHHHIRLNDNFHYQRLLRFMIGKPIGLVLGGGGGKGWISIGTIKALEELQIPIDAIGGTSAGAGMAACYAMTRSFEETQKNYAIIVASFNHMFGLNNLTWPIISLVSAKKQTETTQTVFKNIQIEDLWIPFFAISSNLSTGKEIIHRTGSLWESIRATGALPGIAPPMVINGELHYDGGLLNNLPVDHMKQIAGENSIIIATCLTRGANKIVRYHFPPSLPFRVGLLKKLRLGYKNYHFPPFLTTFMQALLLGSSAKEKANLLKADILICPDVSSHKLFDISNKKISLQMELGYKATMEQLNQAEFLKYRRQ